MPPIIEGPPEPGDAPRPLSKRLGWFALLWVVSLVVVGLIAYGLKALIT